MTRTSPPEANPNSGTYQSAKPDLDVFEAAYLAMSEDDRAKFYAVLCAIVDGDDHQEFHTKVDRQTFDRHLTSIRTVGFITTARRVMRAASGSPRPRVASRPRERRSVRGRRACTARDDGSGGSEPPWRRDLRHVSFALAAYLVQLGEVAE